jgi:hypothetical protein
MHKVTESQSSKYSVVLLNRINLSSIFKNLQFKHWSQLQYKIEGKASFVSVWDQLDLQDKQYLWNILRIKEKEVQDILRLLLSQSGRQKNDRYNDTPIWPLSSNTQTNNTVATVPVVTNQSTIQSITLMGWTPWLNQSTHIWDLGFSQWWIWIVV